MSTARLFILHKPGSWSSRLAKWATGSTAMHIGFVVDDKLFDMNLLWRRRPSDHYSPDNLVFYQCPVEITREDLELELDTSTDVYGFLDYSFFAVKRIFSLDKAPSFKGKICSEKVLDILVRYGWRNPFKSTPSPADFEKVLTPAVPELAK